MFAGHALTPLPGGALWWADRGALIVADLHLEKASAYARRGSFLPPYDSAETLDRLGAIMDLLRPAEVWCLGDSWHDAGGTARLPAADRAVLDALMRRTAWHWIVGNHDPAIVGLPGAVLAGAELGGIVLRHAACPAERRPEISGHYHPKVHVTARGRRVARRCFVATAAKLVLPAFGALAGGLDAEHGALRAVLGRPAAALVPAAGRLLRFPLH